MYFGTVEVCFVIDTTESMSNNKDLIVKAVKQLDENLK